MRILGSRILIVLCPWHDADCFLSQHDASDASWDTFTPDRLNEGRGRRMRRLCARAVRGVTLSRALHCALIQARASAHCWHLRDPLGPLFVVWKFPWNVKSLSGEKLGPSNWSLWAENHFSFQSLFRRKIQTKLVFLARSEYHDFHKIVIFRPVRKYQIWAEFLAWKEAWTENDPIRIVPVVSRQVAALFDV